MKWLLGLFLVLVIIVLALADGGLLSSRVFVLPLPREKWLEVGVQSFLLKLLERRVAHELMTAVKLAEHDMLTD